MNYTNLRINFKLNCNNFDKSLRFEKATLGNNTHIIVDSKYQNCITENNQLQSFNKGGCQIFYDKFNGYTQYDTFNKFIPNESSFTSRIYKS